MNTSYELWRAGKITADEMVRRDPQMLQFVPAPSAQLQCLAVRRDIGALNCIKQPCEAAQLAVATGPYPYGIQTSKRVAPSVQLALASNSQHNHWVKIMHDCGLPAEAYALRLAAKARSGLPSRL